MTDYIKYLKNNRMPLITVDLLSKKPTHPWDDYLYWTQIIHGNQGEDANKEKSNFKPSDIDFQNEKPILTGSGGKIRVYESNNPQQCIILGRGQSFCISQPGNRMWQSYRDTQTSTFYFVYDDTRDDRLGIVVVDVTKNGIILTDRPNNTGTTLDPYTGELTNDSKPYMRYLREKGIDTSKLVNIPKSAEEQKEHEKLGQTNDDLNWFIALSPDYKSKYIGRGHLLTNGQFDHLWENKFNSLLTQYVKTGLELNDHQIDKIAKDRDLRDNYIHNRSIADQHSGNLSNKEYSLFSVKQKESYYNNMNDDEKFDKAIKFDDLDFYKYLIEKGAKIGDRAVEKLAETGNLELVTYLVEKGAKIRDYAIGYAIKSGKLELVEYLVEKGAKIGNGAVEFAARTGNLEIVTYLVEKGAKISDYATRYAANVENLALVKYLVEKGAKIDHYVVYYAVDGGHLHIVKYLVGKIEEKGEKISYDMFLVAIRNKSLNFVKYLVEEKGFKVTDKEIEDAEKHSAHNDIIDYLKSVKERE